MSNLHCLVQDNDSHWYVIPVERLGEWESWLEIGYLDEFGDPRWDWEPAWADRVGGSPSLVRFILPDVERS